MLQSKHALVGREAEHTFRWAAAPTAAFTKNTAMKTGQKATTTARSSPRGTKLFADCIVVSCAVLNSVGLVFRQSLRVVTTVPSGSGCLLVLYSFSVNSSCNMLPAGWIMLLWSVAVQVRVLRFCKPADGQQPLTPSPRD